MNSRCIKWMLTFLYRFRWSPTVWSYFYTFHCYYQNKDCYGNQEELSENDNSNGSTYLKLIKAEHESMDS